MLKTIKKSSNRKLGNCAATYRSGRGSVYSTCPNSCTLKPSTEQGSNRVDLNYLAAVIEAVPREGVAWTYTHFPVTAIPISRPGQTCINISTDTPAEALAAFNFGYPTVVVVPSENTAKVDIMNPGDSSGSIRMVRCPAEYSNATCETCGGDTPLCARPDRNYIIKFTAHGNQAKKIKVRAEGGTETGGCYGNSGPVRIQWEKTKGPIEDDAQILRDFVATLPTGTKLRHHVVGDLG